MSTSLANVGKLAIEIEDTWNHIPIFYTQHFEYFQKEFRRCVSNIRIKMLVAAPLLNAGM